MPFKFSRLDIPDIVHIEPQVFGDDRGFFMETFKDSDFRAAGIDGDIVQVNHSKSQKNVLRGLHFQRDPKAQGKLVSVVSGTIFDVAVDIRKDSSSYGKWAGVELSAEKKNLLFVPPGFAHGFCVLSEEAEVIYYCTQSEYSPEYEGSIVWNDPDLNIDWPVSDPILSQKDAQGRRLKETDAA